jgi:MFS transporter, YNFM family, putative membrane transport protein
MPPDFVSAASFHFCFLRPEDIMRNSSRAINAADARARGEQRTGLMRTLVIGVIAFLTVVDLFATQAILPSLARTYGVDAALIGTAVNAGTLGMAIAGLGVAFLGGGVDHRRTIAGALALLAIPTVLLAFAPGLATFALLRVIQGLLMATAFALTLAYLAKTTRGQATATLFAAYITGNVASNLFGRLMSASIADMFGLQANFIVFAALNLLGGGLAYVALLDRVEPPLSRQDMSGATVARLLADPDLRSAFAIGFCILFAFIGTFTYVNFVLVRPPLSLGMMAVGFAYFVFLPSIFTTPLAGNLVGRFGVRPTMWAALAIAVSGLPMLLAASLPLVLAGMTLIAIGSFLAQANATGFVGRAASADATVASGIYLASYFLGGLVGSVVLGQLFVRFGWSACVAGVAVALLATAALTLRLREAGSALDARS